MAKEKPAAGSKREWGMADYCMVICGVTGALPLFASLVPHVYWRWMNANPYLGMRFPVGRAMSPLSVGNPGGQPIMWGRLARSVCQKQRELNSPDIGTAVLSIAAAAVPQAAALGGCGVWQHCKEAVFARCTTYTTLHYVGLVCCIMIFLGGCCGLGAGMMMSSEESKSIPQLKKMKSSAREKYFEKEKAQRMKTFMVGAIAFLFSFIGVVGWIAMSTVSLNELKSRSFYPMMYLNGPGAICGIVGVVCMFFACVGGQLRNKATEMPDKGEKEDAGGNDYAAAAGPSAPMMESPPPPPPPF